MRLAAALLGCALLAATAPPARFENVAAAAGLTHSFPNGGTASKQFIIETTGSGIAFIDYDNDGLLDLFVASGQGGTNRMYHNDGHGRFSDVTAALGLEQSGWAQGVCAGDYDNDGYTDLFVTYWGANHLYRNIEGRRFEDVTGRAHLTQDRIRYNTGCAFLDYDRDGHLDLFVANYLRFDPKTTPKPGANPYCFYRDMAVNCGPRGLPFDRNILYHAKGDGTFEDVSEASGIAAPNQNYSLGVLTGDFNNDGLPDIYVACDQTPSLLYINRGNGTFEEEAVARGVAFDSNGKALSGMGATAADLSGSGVLDIFRTNFSDERETLYRHVNDRGEFEDGTIAAGMGRNTRFVGWGCGFFDYDNDGQKDLLIVNGHVFPEVDRLQLDIRYKDRAILYRNLGNGRFEDVSGTSGPGILEKHSSRGAAFGDYDNDGNVEVAINNQNEPPALLKQTAPPRNHWVIVKLTGTRSNRSAIGAKVRISAAGVTQSDEVRSGGSYLSQNDLRLHFGLGQAAKIDSLEVEWPGGMRQSVRPAGIDQVISIREAAHETAHETDGCAGRLKEARHVALARPLEAKRLLDGCESAPDAIATAVNVAAERLPALLHDAGDYDKALNAYLELGDWDGAERIALRPDFPALAPRQRVLDALYAAVPARGAALFAELLSMLPRELNDEQLRFLSANMRTLRSIDSGIAVQAAERMLVSRPASNFVFEAGAYLAVYDRPHYLRMELLFAAWRDRLTKMTVGELVRLYPEEPFPVHAVRAGAFDDRWVELLHLDRHAPKPTVVAFWESWCAPCRREAPVLERIRTRGDVNVLLISEASDGGGMLHREFEATTLPLSLIFDSEARLIKRVTGEFSERDLP